MDYLHEVINGHRFTGYTLTETVPLTEIIQFDEYDYHLVYPQQARKFFDYVIQSRTAAGKIWSEQNQADSAIKFEQYTELKLAMKNMISKMKINPHTMYWILRETEKDEYKYTRTSIWNLLCENKTEEFMYLIKHSVHGTDSLMEVPYETDIKIHNYYFEKKERTTL